MIGQVVSHYKIIERLGGGGMGVVYKAEDLKLKRTVALKFLLPQALGTPDEKTRFVHEARAPDPLSLPINTGVGEVLYNNRQYEAALEATRKALELDPNFPAAVGLTAKIHDMRGAHDEVIEYYKKYMTLAGHRVVTAVGGGVFIPSAHSTVTGKV